MTLTKSVLNYFNFSVNLILSGFFLLFFAIIMNAVIQALKIMTWYDLLMQLKHKKWPSSVSVIDILWLFIGYPFFLGLIIYASRFFWIEF